MLQFNLLVKDDLEAVTLSPRLGMMTTIIKRRKGQKVEMERGEKSKSLQLYHLP